MTILWKLGDSQEDLDLEAGKQSFSLRSLLKNHSLDVNHNLNEADNLDYL